LEEPFELSEDQSLAYRFLQEQLLGHMNPAEAQIIIAQILAAKSLGENNRIPRDNPNPDYQAALNLEELYRSAQDAAEYTRKHAQIPQQLRTAQYIATRNLSNNLTKTIKGTGNLAK
jgi:hypothetical protein